MLKTLSQKTDASYSGRKPFGGMKRAAKRAVLYGKIAIAVASFWMVSKPLVSTAQELQPKTVATAESKQKAVDEGKTFTLSKDTAVYDSTSEYAGVRRILVELQDKPEEAQKYCRLYVKIVNSIAETVRDSLGVDSASDREILEVLWKVTSANFKFGKAGFLYKSIVSDTLDCDNSSTIGFDAINVEKKATGAIKRGGEEPEFVVASEHWFLKLGILDYEANAGQIYPHDSVSFYHPEACQATCDLKAAEAVGYEELSGLESDAGNYAKAKEYMEKAVKLNPNDPNLRGNFGHIYSKLGLNDKALEEYNIAVALCPVWGFWYANRAAIYYKMGMQKEADADAEVYTGKKGAKIIVQGNNVTFYYAP